MEKQPLKMHSYPGMAVVIGSGYEGEVNFMSAGWHSFLSMDPPMYGAAVGRERYTYQLIKQSGAFTIHFLPYEEAAFIQYAGSISGVDTNKATSFGQQWKRGENGSPVLESAYLTYECEVDQMIPTGDHDWVTSTITACSYIPEIFNEKGLPDFQNLHIPLYLGRSEYIKLDEKIKKQSFIDPLSYKKS
ncbi:flavin oxidoreductase [Halobacillus halophilus]|uniref:flavin reductase family protein n=1 Tax=Halobacillus halophilus TaxID=1570 RepID=UPI00136937EB|nr:flavin reductase family protein [Halobacillus halophilus]MYL28968.1 flavin oxidoreductase [Halobacillus halophilus]